MPLTRRSGGRFVANIWPGFVDAMTALLLVVIFVLSIFMIIQTILRDRISGQDRELLTLSSQLSDLSDALGIEKDRSEELEAERNRLSTDLDSEKKLSEERGLSIASLTDERDAAELRIASFEEQLATLLAANTDLRSTLDLTQTSLTDAEAEIARQADAIQTRDEALGALESERNAMSVRISEIDAALKTEISEREAASLALARARQEIDASAEEARRAAAEREAMELLIATLKQDVATRDASLSSEVARAETAENGLAALEAETRQAEAALAELRRENSDATGTIDQLRSENESLRAALASETEARAGLERSLEAQQRQAVELAEQLAQAKAEAEGETETLRAALADATRERDLAATQATTSGSEIEALRAQLAEQEAETSNLKTALAGALADAAAKAETIRLANLDAGAKATELAQTEGALETARVELARARSALEAVEAELAQAKTELASSSEQISEQELRLLAQSAAAALIREKLAESQSAFTALELAMEETRKRGEDALLGLASARAAQRSAETAREDQAASLVTVQRELGETRRNLTDERAAHSGSKAELALLNRQTAELRRQLGALQSLLDDAKAQDEANQVQVQSLGADLNAALARLASEEKKRADLEEEKVRLLEREREALQKSASVFFGTLIDVLGAREDVKIEGDRFVFDSSVLFAPGSPELGRAGRDEIDKVAEVIKEVAGEIPGNIDWIIRVDGHTDATPFRGTGDIRDNWELSQARALAVVRYLIAAHDIPPERLAATGFGEFNPVDTGDSPEALRRNRRIELKFTEK